jgi:uncharacterized protein
MWQHALMSSNDFTNLYLEQSRLFGAMLRAGALAVVFIAVPHLALAAPLPCDAPVTPLEKTVCGDKETRSLDEIVHRLYEDALHSTGGNSVEIDRHRKWKEEKRDRCLDLACVKDAYYSRLEELDSFARTNGKSNKGTEPLFQGSWRRVNPSGFEPSHLTVEGETNKEFSFSISAENGVRSGTFFGRAHKVSESVAKYDGDISCQLEFRRVSLTEMTLVESGCNDIGGVGVTFGGKYLSGGIDQEPSVRDFINISPLNASFRDMVGEYYPLFLSTAHLSSSLPVRDPFHATVYAYVVRGLSGVRESIVMIGRDGALWAAVIQPVDGENLTPRVFYFTNQPQWSERIPDTINDWRKEFSTYQIIFIEQKPK